MSHKPHIRRFALTLLALISLALTLPAQALGGEPLPRLAATVPTLVFPAGTIPITRAVYIWTAVSGATQYEYQIVQGATLLLDQAADASVCVAGTCSVMPALDLTNGSYTWRVRALIGGTYQTFSAWQSFTVSILTEPGGFTSTFNSDASGWVVHKGVWSLESSAYYTTPGVVGKAATISHLNDYTTLTYEVRMKRTGCTGCANVIAIRGNPSSLDATGWWKTEYTFDYTNSGLFSVWRDYNGTYTALKNWTSTTAINMGGWNTLRVTANGSLLKFYINDTLVWSGLDSSYPSGRVGIGMYRNTVSSGDKLYVDWAQLSTSVAAPEPAMLEVISENQVEMTGGNHNIAP